jgi:HPt (histidine-containing phosphotransfer) domain-containing protein
MSLKSFRDSSVKTLDPKILAELKEYGDDCVTELVALYLKELSARLAKMRAALAKGDALRLRESAHALKGGSGNIGAVGLLTLCHELELAARRGDLGIAPVLLELIEHEAMDVKHALRGRS